jgi:hypothetical protein
MTSIPNPSRRVYGIAMILAPLLFLASTIAFIVEGDGMNEGVLGGTIGVWSVFAILIAFLGLLRLMEPKAPRAAAILTVLACCGFPAGVAFSIDAILTGALSVEVNEAIDAGFDDAPIAILAFIPWGWFGPLSFLLVGIMLWRTRAVPTWNGALLAATGVLFVVSRMERLDALAVVSDLVLLAALAPIGWRLLTSASPASAAVTPATQVAKPSTASNTPG